MHVVDDVHGIVVNTCNFHQYLLIVRQNFFEVEQFACQYRDILYHDSTGVFATTTIDRKQQSLGQVTTSTKELDLLTDSLIRYTTCDTVVVAVTNFTHQLVVFILYRRCINRNAGTEILETFRQFRTPQNGHVWFW